MFAHDTEAALVAAVALVNSAEEPDTLVSLDDLDAFLRAHAYNTSSVRDDSALAAVQALRAPLRALLTSDRDTAARTANAILAEHRAVPQLVRHGDTDWHLHAVPEDAPLAAQIAVETAMAMADVIRADELSRLGTCADATCEGLVVDLSRNRSRRFCCTACGNRAAVAAYRARKAAAMRSA